VHLTKAIPFVVMTVGACGVPAAPDGTAGISLAVVAADVDGPAAATQQVNAPPIPSEGCIGRPLSQRDFAVRMVSGGLQRSVLFHLPPSYDGARPVPLVLNFHYLFGTPESERDLTHMSTSADAAGYMVAYPAGLDKGFNAGSCCVDQKRDDVGFTRDLLDLTIKNVCVDLRRIYSTGMSNGAAFTFRLACEMSDRIAAFAPVAAPMMMTCTQARRPPPIAFFFGTKDVAMRLFRDPYQWARQDMDGWAARNRCRSTMPRVVGRRGDTRLEAYDCPYPADLGLIVIEDGGHTWPGAPSSLDIIAGKTTTSITANDVMWRFFQNHPLW
jgi:polyhydroxybutyrate depolymerase